ncbi:hypothetical protein [Piscinibacter sakaiensis]|uniref:hypothetical protein n=1 Tax=Piscinibacter sakaiensis TaxID=1547922 RepID=UPI003AAD8283
MSVANLFAHKSAGLTHHEQKALAEVTAHDGSHGYGRHGYQTGWEAQLIRAVTGITPDQAFDPRGVNPTIRRWNRVMTTDADGDLGLVDLFDESCFVPEEGDYGTGAGRIAGGFTTPEAQQTARRQGEAIANGMNTPVFYASQWQFRTTTTKILVPMTSIVVVVPPLAAGAPYGIGFSRTSNKPHPHHTRELVVGVIDGFLRGRTWLETLPDQCRNNSAALPGFHVLALQKNKKITMDSMCDFFGITPVWQKAAKLIFRRTHLSASHTHSAWKLVTMYPDDSDPGWAPSLYFDAPMKTKLTQMKNQQAAQGVAAADRVNKDVKAYSWTGLTCNFAKSERRRHPVPTWA